MANISLTRVNQKLAQVRVLLAGVETELLSEVHVNSLKEAAAFHLVCAYQHYLRELGETYGLKNTPAIGTEAELSAAFYLANKQPVEVDELLALRNTANSWLQQLHLYYEGLWLRPQAEIAATTVAAEAIGSYRDIIAAVNLDTAAAQLQVDIPLILSWHAEFVALAMRQRATSAEF